MHAHYFQHVPFEGLGSIESWLQRRGASVTCTRFFADDPLPSIAETDLLIVMGGPMSINDEVEFPWLVAEKQFIRAMLAAGKPVLGICLGAQLIAGSQGAKIYPNGEKEIGWLPITPAENLPDHAFRFPAEATVFHWHGETFDLPPAAILLASSAACQNQAFQLGRNTIGLQCHLETTPAATQSIVDNCREELVEGHAFIQTEAEILATDLPRYARIHALMEEVLEFMV